MNIDTKYIKQKKVGLKHPTGQKFKIWKIKTQENLAKHN